MKPPPICEIRKGSSPNDSPVLPHRGSLTGSTTGDQKVRLAMTGELNPRASSAITEASFSINEGSHDDPRDALLGKEVAGPPLGLNICTTP